MSLFLSHHIPPTLLWWGSESAEPRMQMKSGASSPRGRCFYGALCRLAAKNWSDGVEPTLDFVTGQLQQYEEKLSLLRWACFSAGEKLSQQVQHPEEHIFLLTHRDQYLSY